MENSLPQKYRTVDAIELLREMTGFTESVDDIQMVVAVYTELAELRAKLWALTNET